MGTHPIFESDFDCLTEIKIMGKKKEEEEALYCICRRVANELFMIACDKCEEWFHGECIDLDESDAKYIKEFYCQASTEAHPECVTRFSKKRDKEQSRKVGIS